MPDKSPAPQTNVTLSASRNEADLGSLLSRMGLAVLAALLYTGSCWWIYHWQIHDYAEHAFQTDLFSGLIFILIGGLLAGIQPSRAKSVGVLVLLGMLAGMFAQPGTSMSRKSREEQLRSGNISLFTPVWMATGAMLGAIAGQNLQEMRRLLNQLNANSPKLSCGRDAGYGSKEAE